MPRASDTPAPSPAALAEQLLAELRTNESADNRAGMARYGIVSANALGVPMPILRGLATDAKRALKRDPEARHELAALLWTTGVHECRVMASLVDVPSLVSEAQMETWAIQLDSWDVCDGLNNNLFRQTPLAWAKAHEWPGRDEEFVKRAGFVLGASLAVHDKAADDARFIPLLALAEREATDERGFVKKSVNWQIRGIGKRSLQLNAEAIAACERILAAHPDSRAARWIARDALRELRGDAVQSRLAAGATASGSASAKASAGKPTEASGSATRSSR